MADCIKQLKIKNNSSFSSPTFIGAEQRFVGALRGANVDNLEEQYIIGVDCVTTEEWSSDMKTHMVTKEFHDSTQSNSNYYKLVIIEYLDKMIASGIASGIMTVSDDENVNNSSDVEIRRESLYFNETLVAVKTVTQKRVNEKVITTEKIERKV